MTRKKAAEIAVQEGFTVQAAMPTALEAAQFYFDARCFVYERKRPTGKKVPPRAILFLGDRQYCLERNGRDKDSSTGSWWFTSAIEFREELRSFKRGVEK